MVHNSFLDFGRVRTIRGHRLTIPMSLVDRVRVSRGTPEAVVRVISYAGGVGRVNKLMQYISRDGKLELETESGDRIMDVAEQKALVASWSTDFDSRKRSRDVVQ